MNLHYELMDESIQINDTTLYRIRATKDSLHAKKGRLGGYIQSLFLEDGVTPRLGDNGWVGGDAKVYDNAKVFGNASVSGEARVYDEARVSGDAKVFGNASVSGNALVGGYAMVFDYARVGGDARVYGEARVFGEARVSGNAWVYDNAWINQNANIQSEDDFCYFNSFGSKNRTTTAFKCGDGVVRVKCGCFGGDLDEFRERVIDTHGNSKHAKEYLLMIEMIKVKFNIV